MTTGRATHALPPQRAAVLRRALEGSLLVLVAASALKSLVPLDATATFAGMSLVSLPKLAGGVFLVLLAAHAWRQRRRYGWDATFTVVAVFLLLSLAASLTATLVLRAGLTTLRYAAFAALFVAISILARDPRLRTRLVAVLVAACTAATLVGLGGLLAGYRRFANTPFGDQNDFAFLLATTLPLAVWLAGRPGIPRWPARAAALLIGLTAVLTMSRGAIVAGVAGLAWLVIVERRYVRVVGIAALVVAVLVAVVVITDPAPVQDSLYAKRRVAQANVDNRIAAWTFALELVREHPLLGVGPGNFAAKYEPYWQSHPGAHHLTVVHDSYLEIAAENGVPAFVVFAGFCAVVFLRLFVARNEPDADRDGMLALRVALVIAAVASVFVSAQLNAPVWILAGLATAAWHDRASPA